jgi:hypothetical protein
LNSVLPFLLRARFPFKSLPDRVGCNIRFRLHGVLHHVLASPPTLVVHWLPMPRPLPPHKPILRAE